MKTVISKRHSQKLYTVLCDNELGYLGTIVYNPTIQVEEVEDGIKFTISVTRYVFADLLYPEDYWEIVNLKLEGISPIRYEDIDYFEDFFKADFDFNTLKMHPTDKTEVIHKGYFIFLPVIFEDGVWGEDCPDTVSVMPIGFKRRYEKW